MSWSSWDAAGSHQQEEDVHRLCIDGIEVDRLLEADQEPKRFFHLAETGVWTSRFWISFVTASVGRLRAAAARATCGDYIAKRPTTHPFRGATAPAIDYSL